MLPFITYMPGQLGYCVGPKPLTGEQQHKLKLIHDINVIEQKLGKNALSAAAFDELWDMPLNQLLVKLNDQAAFLASSHIY